MSEGLVEPVPFEPRRRASRPGRPRRPLSPGLVLGLLALLLAGGLLASARAVEVRIEPTPDRVEVAGWPHLKLGGLRLMLPGRYALVAEKAGFRRLEAPLQVTGDPRQVARFALERLPGLLALAVVPAAGVRVGVDGAERGVTPLAPVELAAGEHEVRLQAEGYAPFAARVEIAGGGALQRLEASLVVDRARVTLTSVPAGASLRVDGAELGRTPLSVDLTSGSRLVELDLPGYRRASRRVEVVAEQPLSVPPFRLQALPAVLRVASEPAGAELRVDGRFQGVTPVEVELEAGGSHAVRLTKAGHDAAEARVSLERGETRSLSLALAAQTGEVEVVVEPADAELLVDGQSQGRGGRTLRLSAEPHQLELRRQGFVSHGASLTPRPGFPQSLRVRLRSQEEAQAAARPALLRTPAGHELRLVEGGRFALGASRREPGRRANETQREVELARPSYVATLEVTNAQFRRFKPDHSSGRFGAYSLDQDDHPVVQVTWEQAAEYCNWLSAQEGLGPVYVMRDGRLAAGEAIGTGYRLPTEAEWARVARYPGRGPLRYPWGDAPPAPPGSGNFADESARPLAPVVLQGYQDRYPATAPVGSFPPNGLGFHDLGGNVAEWVHDVYWIPPAELPLQRDPAGPPPGELHVIRGSSFLQGSLSELRLSYRDYGTKPRADVGFRVARYAE